MISYEETMALGATEYADVTAMLRAEGLPGEFTQTGGMNAAIEVRLESGYSLLITEAEDSLAWHRVDHETWGVGLYRENMDEGALRFQVSETGDLAELLPLIRLVLEQPVRVIMRELPKSF